MLTGMLHRDPKIWGDNPEAFRPRSLQPGELGEDSAERLQAVRHGAARVHRAAVRAAGAGLSLVLAMLLQRFEFIAFAESGLETKQTLTIKPVYLGTPRPLARGRVRALRRGSR